jgi:hypothetical protein
LDTFICTMLRNYHVFAKLKIFIYNTIHTHNILQYYFWTGEDNIKPGSIPGDTLPPPLNPVPPPPQPACGWCRGGSKSEGPLPCSRSGGVTAQSSWRLNYLPPAYPPPPHPGLMAYIYIYVYLCHFICK